MIRGQSEEKAPAVASWLIRQAIAMVPWALRGVVGLASSPQRPYEPLLLDLLIVLAQGWAVIPLLRVYGSAFGEGYGGKANWTFLPFSACVLAVFLLLRDLWLLLR